MTKSRSTKSALISSVLALLLCFAMLLGSTFAWFTDSVTSANNVIQTGNLKVDLEVLEEKDGVRTWTSVKTTNAPIFNYQNWEPGYVETKVLRVENEGSLALKWKATLNSPNGVSELAEVIDVYVMAWGVQEDDTVAGYPKNRELTGYTYVGTLDKFIEDIETTTQGALNAGEKAYLALAFKMQESAGNKYQGMELGEFTLQILATQYNAESDSFDPDYDKDAMYPGEIGNAEELAAALAEGGSYKLVNDIVTEQIEIPAGITTVVDLNGKTLTGAEYTTSDGAGSRNNVVNNYGELTITGEGTIRTRNLKNNVGAKLVIDGNIEIIGGVAAGGSAIWNEGDCVINGATISQTNDWNYAVQNVADNATMVINNASVSANHGAISNTGANTTLEINGGTFECLASGHTVYVTAGSVTINGGSFKHSQQNATAEGNCVVYAKSTVEINGGSFDSVNAAFAYKAHNASITVSGGTFANSAKNVYSNGTLNDFVADGFKAVESDGKYVVVADNVDNVIVTADDLLALSGKYVVGNNGTAETITYALMADIDLGGAEFKELGVAYGDTVNFLGNGHTISNFKLSTGNHNGMTNVGMFYVDSGATLNVSDLTLNDVTVADGVNEYTTGAAVVVGYANGAVNLTDVDVNNAKVNNTYGNAAIYVGYGVNEINLTDCDVADFTVSGEVENGAVRTDKTGAYVGTANTTSCVVTVTNCTNGTAYKYAGRVINDATMTVDGSY